MPEIQSLEFNRLPEAMRQRFLASVRSSDRDTAPMVREVSSDRGFVIKMIVAAVLLALVVTGVCATGFGDLDAEGSLWQGNAFGIGYIVCAALFFLCLLLAARRVAQKRGLPYPPGKYLYAFSLIETRLAAIDHYDLSKAAGIKSTPVRDREGRYKGTRFVFYFGNGKEAEIVENDFDRAKELGAELARRQNLVKEAVAAGNAALLLRHDPFNALRTGAFVPGKVVPGEFMAKAPSELLRWSPIVALGLGLLCGIGIWFGRNHVSDDTAYGTAKAGHHEQDYAKYIKNGHRHVQEMQDALPHVALDEAKKTHSVTRIRSVGTRYPDAGLGDEIKAEVHKLYTGAAERFAAQAANADPALVPFVQNLLANLEASGNPTVQVRFTRPSADELGTMDTRLGRFAATQGKKMVPSAAWFANDNVTERENRIVEGLQQGFGAIFREDVLHISAPTRIDPSQPSMDISYQISGSGNYYTITRDRKSVV